MSHLDVRGLRKTFAAKPPTTAIDDLSFSAESGEFIVLLGPSGCGKTTTLRCLAGLEQADEGVISVAGERWFDSSARIGLPPERRNIGMVFQSYALWPHMTVRKNITYPLRARRTLSDATAGWVDEAARLVDVERLLDRYPSQLSGGQQQRVSLARSIVSRPDMVLFDEPLSNLDAKLRDDVRAQLHELHQKLRFTAVFVTHDQSEALALADRVAVMRQGRFEQFGPPAEVFDTPASEYVAGFIGFANRLRVRREGDAFTVDGVALSGAVSRVADGPEFAIRIRPEETAVLPADAAAPDLVTMPATVTNAVFGGRHMDVYMASKGTALHAQVSLKGPAAWVRTVQPGAAVRLGFRPEDARAFSADDGVALRPELMGARA